MGYKSSPVAIRQLDRHSTGEKGGGGKKLMGAILSFSLREFVSRGIDCLPGHIN